MEQKRVEIVVIAVFPRGGDWRDNLLKRKQDFIDAAVELFAGKGFDATTFGFAGVDSVIEPVIYYHFKNKNRLFRHILKRAVEFRFFCLEALPTDTVTAFEKSEDLIDTYFQIKKNARVGFSGDGFQRI